MNHRSAASFLDVVAYLLASFCRSNRVVSRRLSLAFVILLCLGLSLPALAEPGQGGGQGGGPPASTTLPTGPPTSTTHPSGPPTTVTNPGGGQGSGPPTTVTNPGSGHGNGQGNAPPTTVTTHASGSNSNGGSGQGSGSPTTVTTDASGSNGNGSSNGNSYSNGQGNGQNNGTPGPSTTVPTDRSTPGGASADVTGSAVADRIAVFLAPLRVSQDSDSYQSVGDGQTQSASESMISWLLSANEQRFLPVVASPLVALLVVGRALTSAGSGAVAPIALLVALAATKEIDRRRGRLLAAIPASN